MEVVDYGGLVCSAPGFGLEQGGNHLTLEGEQRKDLASSATRSTTNTTNSTIMMTPITRPPTSPELMLLLCSLITTTPLVEPKVRVGGEEVGGEEVGVVEGGAEVVSGRRVVGSRVREQTGAIGESS